MVNIEIKQELNNNVPDHVSFYLLDSHQIDGLVGKMLGNIETLGLTEKQEEAFKKLVKREIWASVDSEYQWVSPEIASLVLHMRTKMKEVFEQHYREQESSGKVPTSLKGEYAISFRETK